MEAVRLHKVIQRDGEIFLTGLLCKKGQQVEMILLIEPSAMRERPNLTASRLLHSGMIGL